SYNSADKHWAEWIAWQLEEAGYTTIIQAWDFRPGGNFVVDMQRAAEEAERTIAVLSQNYLDAIYTQPEWAVAFAQDPTGGQKTLLPVRIQDCHLKGLLSQIVYIDLAGKPEAEARDLLLSGIKTGRAKPDSPPGFPSGGSAAAQPETPKPSFPVETAWGEQHLSPAERTAILQQGPSVANIQTGGVRIGSVGGDIKGSIISAGDVSHVTITLGGQPTPADKAPTPDDLKQLLAEIRQELAEVLAQKEALEQVSAAAPFAAQGAEATLKAAAEQAGEQVEPETAKSMQQSLSEASTLLNGILDSATAAAEKATEAGQAVKPIADKLAPLVEKLGVAAVWVGRLWLGLGS
ncbi:MAG: toll/interleukin-1 receptor domain-containing protein, partial [Anaerolineae bacterium]|nr:toll/interleukin-1 receptor domain-containing protein [Anaerolineae bacterium]